MRATAASRLAGSGAGAFWRVEPSLREVVATALLARLEDPSPVVRFQAARTVLSQRSLEALPAPVGEILASAFARSEIVIAEEARRLGSTPLRARRRAAQHLTMASYAPAQPLLEAGCSDPDPVVRGECLLALVHASAEAPVVHALLGKALLDPDARVRIRAARLVQRCYVARQRMGALFEPTVAALRDEETVVRAYAARALGECSDADAPRAVAALTTAIADGSWRVRRGAAISLGQLGLRGQLGAEGTRALEEASNDPRVAPTARKALAKVLARARWEDAYGTETPSCRRNDSESA